jgi:hypothetical protein
MSNRDLVLAYLKMITPRTATNADICSATGIKPHPQVLQITRLLKDAKAIRGRQLGKEWHFSWKHDASLQSSSEDVGSLSKPQPHDRSGIPITTPAEFELLARAAMERHYRMELRPGSVLGVPKRFDLVSNDRSIVGDAKYFTLVNGIGLPPAKFSIIAEYVWLLEKVPARTRFLIFGNDRRVPERWLATYGSMVSGIAFYFLAEDGNLLLLC